MEFTNLVDSNEHSPEIVLNEVNVPGRKGTTLELFVGVVYHNILSRIQPLGSNCRNIPIQIGSTHILVIGEEALVHILPPPPNI